MLCNICKIYIQRINLETFSFNQPIQNDNSSAFVCGSDLDLLKLSALGIPLIELSVLCGELSGQHRKHKSFNLSNFEKSFKFVSIWFSLFADEGLRRTNIKGNDYKKTHSNSSLFGCPHPWNRETVMEYNVDTTAMPNRRRPKNYT